MQNPTETQVDAPQADSQTIQPADAATPSDNSSAVAEPTETQAPELTGPGTVRAPIPQPHADGGATLVTGAVAAGPVLIARVEVYKDAEGTFYTNITRCTGSPLTLPQHRSESAEEVRGAVDEFLTEQLAA